MAVTEIRLPSLTANSGPMSDLQYLTQPSTEHLYNIHEQQRTVLSMCIIISICTVSIQVGAPRGH